MPRHRPDRSSSVALAREAEVWQRWIMALRAGSLWRWIARQHTDTLVVPDALARLWSGAARETSWRLLLNAARERLLEASRSRDCLRVDLPGSAIALPLARLGAFELDWPELAAIDDPRLEDPLAIVELLGERERLPELDRARLRAEILDSIVNLAQARLARSLRDALAREHGLVDPRLADPEHFVTDGHPWHPMNRTRLGLRRAEVVRYAAEQLADTPVACVEIAERIARVAGDWLEESRRWFGEATPGFVRIPIHPAQRRRIPGLFPDLWATGAIRPVERPAIACRSLLSLRTVALAPERHLKLACDVHTTSTRRWVSPMSVRNGPELTRLLLDIQARDPIAAQLRLLEEPAAAGLEPERLNSGESDLGPERSEGIGARAGEAEHDPSPTRRPSSSDAGMLGAILRAAPRETESERAWVCAAIGERWPGTEELVIERAAAGYPGGRRERIAALVEDWIDRLVPASLRLFAVYGIALELHLQNTLVRVVDGRVAGFWVRDLGGIRIHAPRLAAAGLPRMPSFAADSFIVTDDLDEVRSKLEHTLIHAQLAHLFAIAGTLGVDEVGSYGRLRQRIERDLNAWADDPDTSVGARERLLDDLRELTRPRVRAKALLRMRLRERSSDYDYTEVANALVDASLGRRF
ncbi:MAG TPA: IucA/IucC family protein [Enhygromyxa sp.]|nr:IucA/IucC family protein [Enhygromyxa sp.]